MGYKIVITCDRTLASEYNGLLFFGYISSYPEGIPPDFIYYRFLCPSIKSDEDGRMLRAGYGMRKIEAALLNNGFTKDDVIVAHPDKLSQVIDENTKIVAISALDPLGLGPVTSTFSQIFGGTGKMVGKLEELLNSVPIRKYRPAIVLGGAGAWQFSIYPERQKQLGIDCVIVGDGDITAPEIFNKIVSEGCDSVPPLVNGKPAKDENIYDIEGSSIVGIVEVTRGCARSCAFCDPALKTLQSRPIENIIKEVKVNLKGGYSGALLHSEDILLYGSDGLNVKSEKVVELFRRIKEVENLRWLGAVHTSFSSVKSSPETIAQIAEILADENDKNKLNYFQIGIETASPKLIRRHMKGKVYPFKPEEWSDVVLDGMKILHDHNFAVAATIILGLPGEDENDLTDTLKLVHLLKEYRIFLVPLLFTSMENTNLKNEVTLKSLDLTPKHIELFKACWKHNLKWIPVIWTSYGRKNNRFTKSAIKVALKISGNILILFLTRLLKKQTKRFKSPL